MRLLIALIAASIAISITDWLFFGVLFHDRYMQTPNIWREGPESRKIAGSMAAFALAVLVWIAASLPQTATNTLYVRYSPILGVSHAIGWLARLVITASAYAIIVG
jgi:hypothetical protein